MVIGLDCAVPDLVFNRWLTKSAAYEAGPDQNQSAGFGRLTDQRHRANFLGGKILEMESRFAHLDALESQSIYILREAYRKFKRLAMVLSIGPNAQGMMWLLREA